MYGSPVGTANVTSSQQLLSTDYKGRVFSINFMASGTSSTIKLLTNGVSGTVLIHEQSTESLPKTVDFGINGYLFDNGIYVQFDAQSSRVTVSYRQEEKNNP